jgi:hypothetical protein
VDFPEKLWTFQEPLKLSQQLQAIQQERTAGLVALETVHQLDCAAPLQPENPLDGGAVQDRSIQGGKLLDDLWKSKQPLWIRRHLERTPFSLCYCTVVQDGIPETSLTLLALYAPQGAKGFVHGQGKCSNHAKPERFPERDL